MLILDKDDENFDFIKQRYSILYDSKNNYSGRQFSSQENNQGIKFRSVPVCELCKSSPKSCNLLGAKMLYSYILNLTVNINQLKN